MDVGTVSSDDVIASYRRQLQSAHEQIAMLEAALTRDQRAAPGSEIAVQSIHDSGTRGEVPE